MSEKYKEFNYSAYFFYEFENFFKDNLNSIQNLKEIKETKLDLFKQKRKIGENDHYICELIRNDLFDNFISHVSQLRISLFTKIEPSIYETNSFLNKRTPTMIEYSVFYGSIQIFKYLFLNRVELTPSLWVYSIHGKNSEIIHFLEENNVLPEDSSYNECLIESIKCHHNDIANYFLNNFINFNHYDCIIFEKSFQYNNYEFFPNDLDNLFFLDELCRFNYVSIFNLLINKENINKRIIQNKSFFFK